MKSRNTVILLVLVAGLLVLMQVCERRARSAPDGGALLLDFDREDVTAITIRNNDETVELRRKDAAWLIERPVKDRADPALVGQILSLAASMEKHGVIELGDLKDGKTRQQLKTLGLQKGRVSLKLSGRKRMPEIWFGKDTAVEGQVYVRRDSEGTVFAIPGQLRGLVTRPTDDFRDHRLYATDASLASRFTIKTASGEIEMEKDGEHWEIRKPVKARGDDRKITDIIKLFTGMPIVEFVTDTKGTPTGLGEPRGTVTLVMEGGSRPAVLEVGQADANDPEKVFARFTLRDAFYKVPKTVDSLLALKPNDVRDPGLGRLNSDIVDRIGIEPAGRPRITLIRDRENWQIAGEPRLPANRAAAERLLRGFKREKAVEFVDDVASDLARYGLDHPSLKVTFSSYSSENTPESAAGERPFLSVLFGREEGGKVFALVEDEPFVIAVRKEFVTSIPAEPVLWSDLQILKMRAQDIVSMTVAQNGGPALAFSRVDASAWRLEKGGAEPDSNAVESIASTLANLRAARMVGASGEAAAGLDRPLVDIRYTTAGKQEGRLLVGAPDDDGMFHAKLDGQPEIFILGRPDVEVLRTALLRTQPEASQTPAPAK